MRLSLITTLGHGFVSTRVWSQEIFEPSDFDITKALLKKGVNISHTSGLAGLTESSALNGCSIACNSLQQIFGESRVEHRGDRAYETIISYFWSAQQQEPRPQCIFKPDRAVDISTLVLISRLTQCPFAVRSGGHAAFAGASSADNGITVSFENMKRIALSENKNIASIQPGNLWYDIYTNLAKDNLAVVGGRVSAIGIGGLTTGGGISFFSNQYGWACDNVASYEVVTASGVIVNASTTSFPDLYWALRGGGNNFGIVTTFHLNTFAHGPLMFGGQRRFLKDSFPAVINAFTNLGLSPSPDPKAAHFIAVVLDPATNTQIAVAELEYADPVLDPPVFAEYMTIPTFSDTTKLDTLAYFTQQLNASNPKGYRETYWTASSKLDRQMVEFLFRVTFEEFDTVRDIKGILPANTFQVISISQLENMQKRGGNALGLNVADGPILLININIRWERKKDDARVMKASENIVRRMREEAQRRGMWVEYLYMNYASEFQDVIGSYGEEQVERLKAVAKKYDPKGVFQELQPGYFKLDGAPVR